ncbi:MAG: hypothetical protein NVSMB51_09260 [Solirubrobacteraceae bacterium]
MATVTVSAFPAVKLLWGSADSVSVHMSDLEADPGQSGALLGHTDETAQLEVLIDRLRVGPLLLTGARMHKHGSELSGTAALAPGDLRAALPPGFEVQPLAGSGGELLLRASASLLGIGVSANAAVEAQDGALVIQPVGIPLFKLTVFADPHVRVDRVGAQPGADGAYQLSATATLR